MQSIVLVGLNHKAAPVELREKLAFGGKVLEDTLSRFGSDGGGQGSYGEEGVILSTCNRLEIYTVASSLDAGHDNVCSLLEDSHGESRALFEPYFYTYADEQAAGHLFSVAAGLDSMVLGEHQILGQVTRAMEAALAHGAAGKLLVSLFRHAIEVGKRARTETAISRGTTSLCHAAVELVGEDFGDFSTSRLLLVGAGEMAELAGQALVEAGVRNLSILNRTRERAEKLATRFEAQALDWEERELALTWADIVIVSTSAPQAVFRRRDVSDGLIRRRGRRLLFVDISVPRNVDPAVEELENVFRYDIDDLERVIEHSLAGRRQEVPKVEAIVGEVQQAFMSWYRSLDVVPTIVDLRRNAHAVRRAEIERALRRLPELTDRDREIIASATKRIVNKLLHHPTIFLKQQAGRPDGQRYAQTARDLLGLDGEVEGQ